MRYDVYKCFIPECFLDTNLVELIFEKTGVVNHKKGNSSVLAAMQSDKLKDNFAVAIIDDDKVKVKALEEFNLNVRLSKVGLKIYKHPLRAHFVIQLSPAIEQWILRECAKAEVNMGNYGLEDNLETLRKMKAITQRSDERFKRLFREMMQCSSCDEIIELKRWLIFLKDNNYNTDLDLL